MFKCLSFIMIMFFSCSLVFCQSIENKVDAAIDVSKEWLQMVDEENYFGSWEQAATYFKSAVTKEQWDHSNKLVREPLGKVIIRMLDTTNYSETLPGAPDGEYVVIQYKTSFDNKKSAVETITPMLDKDGVWRVSGYYIK